MSAHPSPDGFALTVHPGTPCPWVRELRAQVAWTAEGGLRFHYLLEGDLRFLRLPEPQAAGRRDRLWEHTCCEAFLGTEGAEAYLEFNFSPSSAWAAYAFLRYRDPAPEVPGPGPAVLAGIRGDRLDVVATLPGGALAALPRGEALRLGLAAVLEDLDGACAYWALRHPAGQPDFHHRDAFAITLAAPTGVRP